MRAFSMGGDKHISNNSCFIYLTLMGICHDISPLFQIHFSAEVGPELQLKLPKKQLHKILFQRSVKTYASCQISENFVTSLLTIQELNWTNLSSFSNHVTLQNCSQIFSQMKMRFYDDFSILINIFNRYIVGVIYAQFAECSRRPFYLLTNLAIN